MNEPGKFSSRLGRYAPLLIWMAFIFFASTGNFSADNTGALIRPLLLWFFPDLSNERLIAVHFFIRKLAHFTEYAILGLLTARAFIDSSRAGLRRHWFVDGLILIILYALSDEYHQSFVAARTASIFDSLIDISGGLFALMMFALWRNKTVNRKPETVNSAKSVARLDR
ncbi:MAG TPA: VanZ family protein [Pyrinomonadaceae bacterium]|nr:VanZ family protein [Pyrinomonadaceae bacterium]